MSSYNTASSAFIDAPVIGQDYVYFTATRPYAPNQPSEPKTLRRIPRCGGQTRETRFSVLHYNYVDEEHLGAVGGHVYWFDADRVWVLDETTNEVTTVAVPEDCLRDLTGDATGIYYLDGCANEIVSVPYGSNECHKVITSGIPPNAEFLAVGSQISVASESMVAATPLSGGATVVCDAPARITELGADVSAVYVTTFHAPGFAIHRVAMDASVTTMDSDAGPAVLDGGSAYWRKLGPDSRLDAVVRVDSAAPGTPEPLIPRAPWKFDVVGGRLYWFEGNRLLSALSEPVPHIRPATPGSLKCLGTLDDAMNFQALAVTSSGDMIAVLGETASAFGNALVRFGSDGSHVWTRELRGSALRVGPNDDITVAVGPRGALFRLDSDSTILWSREPPLHLGGPFDVDGSGGVVWASREATGSLTDRRMIERLDSAGNSLWHFEVAEVAGSLLDIAALPDGRTTVVLPSHLLGLSADGQLEWTRRLPEGSFEIVATPDGGAVLFGESEDVFEAGAGLELVASPGRRNTFFARYDSEGQLTWTRSYLGGFVTNIAGEPNGGLFLFALGDWYFGDTGGPGNYPIGPFLAALDENGGFLWSQEVPDYVTSPVLAPDGKGGVIIGQNW